MSIKLTLVGRPVSKKNSRRNFVHKYTKKVVSLPSKAYDSFRASVLADIKSQFYSQNGSIFDKPVHVSYTFYRKGRYSQDNDNAMGSINDILQDSGIIENDALIDRGDFRVVHGVKEWRTVVTITPIDALEDKKNTD